MTEQLPAFIFYVGAGAAILLVLALAEGFEEWRRKRLDRLADSVVRETLRTRLRATVWAYAAGAVDESAVAAAYLRIVG